MSDIIKKQTNEPNQKMERSRLPVTHPAFAGCAPGNRLAHHDVRQNRPIKPTRTEDLAQAMFDDDEYEEYDAMSLEALGTQGCCKIFCEEYRRICPDVKIMACKREDGSISHVFIERNERYFDARGERDLGDMLDDGDIEAVEISESEFIGYYTIASESQVMRSVCRKKFAEALTSEKEKYGL